MSSGEIAYIRLALEMAGALGGLLLLYWRIASRVSTWGKDLEVAKGQLETLDQKIDELIVRVALLNERSERR